MLAIAVATTNEKLRWRTNVELAEVLLVWGGSVRPPAAAPHPSSPRPDLALGRPPRGALDAAVYGVTPRRIWRR